MRIFMRVVLPIAIVIGLVGGVSYFLQYTPPPPAPPTKIDSSGPPLVVPERVGAWDADDPNYGREYEKGTKGHFDFWVMNPNATPTSILLRAKGCTCASVELGQVPHDALVANLRTEATLGAALGVVTAVGFNPSLLAQAELMQKIEFLSLTFTDAPRQIPAADPRIGGRLAIVRLNWDTKNLGPMRHKADVDYFGPDLKPIETHFEVPIVVVPPVLVVPSMPQVGVLKAGDTRQFELTFWTSTRDGFPLELPNLKGDPCIILGTPRPISPEELRQFTEQLANEQRNMPPSRMRAGYRVLLTIHERLGNEQLELGPFARKLTFNPNSEFESFVILDGSVKGDIRIDGKDDDRVHFGDFRCDKKATKVVTLISSRADLKLKEGEVPSTCDALKASLRQRGTSIWELCLTVEAEALTGPFPTGTSVVLTTLDPLPRRIRIPILGAAFMP